MISEDDKNGDGKSNSEDDQLDSKMGLLELELKLKAQENPDPQLLKDIKTKKSTRRENKVHSVVNQMVQVNNKTQKEQKA